MRILVIEDDLVIAEQLTRSLEREKFVVDLFRNGREGEEAVFRESYALIILDIMLPERDGWTICENMRRAKITAPILMLTARDTIDDRIKGLQGGK